MKWVKRAAMIVFLLAVAGAIAYGFMPKPVPSEFARAVRGDLRVTIDEEARTRVKDRFTVSSPLAGVLTRITLKVGDQLEVGSRIAELRPSRPLLLDARSKAQAEANIKSAEATLKQAQAALDAAKAELELAVKEHNRAKTLFQGKHISQEQVDAAATREIAAKAAHDSAEFGRQAAEFQLQMARAALIEEDGELQAIEIRSPVAGAVLRVYRESEGPVMPGEMLVEIGDPASLEVVVDLLSSDAVRVKPGMSVSIERWGGDEPLEGSVRRVEPAGFTKVSSLGVEEQRVNVIIDFVGKPEQWTRLGDAFRVEARVITSERKGVIKVPTGAIFNTPEGTAVFVVAEGKARLTRVDLGDRNGLEAEVLSAINEGDTVVVHPSDEISDGTGVIER